MSPLDSGGTPFDPEETESQWRRQLDEINKRGEEEEADLQAAFETARGQLERGIEEKRKSLLEKLEDDIHRYMTNVREEFDNILQDLHDTRLRALESEHGTLIKEHKVQERKRRAAHYNKYMGLFSVGGSDLFATPRLARPTQQSPTPRGSEPSHWRVVNGQVGRQTPSIVAPSPSEPSRATFTAYNGARESTSSRSTHQPEPTAGLSADPGKESAAVSPHQHLASKFPVTMTTTARDTNSHAGLSNGIKRKADSGSTESADHGSKRARTQEWHEDGLPSPLKEASQQNHQLLSRQDPSGQKGRPEIGATNDQEADTSNRRSSQRSLARSISFDEVYQDGEAEFKHIIVEYPQNEGKWYILKCDEHHVHFGPNPLLGAAKHLHSVQHGNLPKLHAKAVELLGHVVFDCDEKLAEMNNAVVKKAMENGYKPYNVNRLTRAERIIQGLGHLETQIPPKQPRHSENPFHNSGQHTFKAAKPAKPFTGITNPVPGELYLGFWSQTRTHYAIMVFPWGDLTLTAPGLLHTVPRCYITDRLTGEIKGWAKGFEDGGPNVTKREFPVSFLDGKHQVGWLHAKHITEFNLEDPNWSQIPMYHYARDTYAIRKGFTNYQTMKMQLASGPLREPLASNGPGRSPMPASTGGVPAHQQHANPSSLHNGNNHSGFQSTVNHASSKPSDGSGLGPGGRDVNVLNMVATQTYASRTTPTQGNLADVRDHRGQFHITGRNPFPELKSNAYSSGPGSRIDGPTARDSMSTTGPGVLPHPSTASGLAFYGQTNRIVHAGVASDLPRANMYEGMMERPPNHSNPSQRSHEAAPQSRQMPGSSTYQWLGRPNSDGNRPMVPPQWAQRARENSGGAEHSVASNERIRLASVEELRAAPPDEALRRARTGAEPDATARKSSAPASLAHLLSNDMTSPVRPTSAQSENIGTQSNVATQSQDHLASSYQEASERPSYPQAADAHVVPERQSPPVIRQAAPEGDVPGQHPTDDVAAHPIPSPAETGHVTKEPSLDRHEHPEQPDHDHGEGSGRPGSRGLGESTRSPLQHAARLAQASSTPSPAESPQVRSRSASLSLSAITGFDHAPSRNGSPSTAAAGLNRDGRTRLPSWESSSSYNPGDFRKPLPSSPSEYSGSQLDEWSSIISSFSGEQDSMESDGELPAEDQAQDSLPSPAPVQMTNMTPAATTSEPSLPRDHR